MELTILAMMASLGILAFWVSRLDRLVKMIGQLTVNNSILLKTLIDGEGTDDDT